MSVYQVREDPRFPELLFVLKHVPNLTPRFLRDPFDSHDCAKEIRKALVARKCAYSWQKEYLTARANGVWIDATCDAAQIDSLLHEFMRFYCVTPNWEGLGKRVSAEHKENGTPLESVFPPAVTYHDHSTKSLLSRAIKGDIVRYPQLHGFLSHPISGKLRTHWEPWEEKYTQLAPADDFVHLPKLFSSFNLCPEDHCLLYSFLLGCFHASSIDSARPILFITSQYRGRGKSQITEAFGILLDGDASTLPLLGSEQSMSDSVIAHLLNGRRVLSLSNLARKKDWENSFLSSLATDGQVAGRGKYKGKTQHFPGIICIMNAVFGQVSLGEDTYCRIWPVTLLGEPHKLEIEPQRYAQEHRTELHREILLAHVRASYHTPYCPFQTRFHDFAAAGYAAYVEVFHPGCYNYREIDSAQAGAPGFSTAAIATLSQDFPGLLREPYDRIVSPLANRKSIPEGSRALGYTFQEGKWHDNLEISP